MRTAHRALIHLAWKLFRYADRIFSKSGNDREARNDAFDSSTCVALLVSCACTIILRYVGRQLCGSTHRYRVDIIDPFLYRTFSNTIFMRRESISVRNRECGKSWSSNRLLWISSRYPRGEEIEVFHRTLPPAGRSLTSHWPLRDCLRRTHTWIGATGAVHALRFIVTSFPGPVKSLSIPLGISGWGSSWMIICA